MAYLVWLLKLIPSVSIELLAKAASPILALFCGADGWLPPWLSWFSTPDNSCDGDETHRSKWRGSDPLHSWMRRTAWLFRNSAYGFNLWIGFHSKNGDIRILRGNPNVGDRTGVSGSVHYKVLRNGRLVAFQHYCVKHYRIFGAWRCVRFGIGYKIWSDPSSKMYGQYWIYFNPFKGSGLNGK